MPPGIPRLSLRALPAAQSIKGFNRLTYPSRTAQRFTSSQPSYPPSSSNQASKGSRNRSPLLTSAAAGFAAGLIFVLAKRYSSPAQSLSELRCDGAPNINVTEGAGSDWTPAAALEQDDPSNPMRIRMALWVKALQDHIVTTLEAIEAAHPPTTESPSSTAPKFLRDHWLRKEGGEGSSCVISGGRVFEKAGVNVSIVHGNLPPAGQKQMRADHASLPIRDGPVPFFATGISIVIHPRNPHVPTVHLNYRYFEVEDPEKGPGEPAAWWFGGGTDLTPSYLVEDDVRHFHSTLRSACDAHGDNYWKTYKPWCDKYFYIPHRGESRGVGGIFFDDLTSSSEIHGGNKSKEDIFGFVKDVSSAFLPAYVPIVQKNKDREWTEEERRWQLLRRGRYAEFNLVYDRGTKFGLMTPGARIESILMSLPEVARWEYMTKMGAEGTPEGDIQAVLKKPREWA